MKIENTLKKGISMARHFVVKFTGSHGLFLKLGTPAFCSESIGFVENIKRRKYIHEKM